MSKTYDVILWGATGFTGRLVAEYLLKQYSVGKDLSWAMAGRNKAKLEKIREELGNTDIPLVVADSHNRESLEAMVEQTKVICTTVGPYALYGNLLLEVCVAHSVDYCDLTGEVQWMRRTIDAHHEKARENQVKIVHCCGFDSIPSDMGVFFLQQEAQKRWKAYADEIKFRLMGAKGGPSGGTIASLDNVAIEAQKDPQLMEEVILNPYGLNPKGEQTGKDVPDLRESAYDEDFQAWIAPFVMAVINTKVVRRSHALSNYPYGKDFRYEEATHVGSGIANRIKASITATVTDALFSPGSILKRIIDQFLPDPGQGPSKRQRETGFFKAILLGKSANDQTLKVKVKGDRDPGYGSTSKMLAEAAVCLAKDRENLPQNFGVITPSTAMGTHLLNRLQENAGVTFSVVEE
ncbi:saccharopine dehydrogenase [marine bacterium AO1-C]|nr:saccharopine dehydrogenase [marine bacterium AO1-C]